MKTLTCLLLLFFSFLLLPDFLSAQAVTVSGKITNGENREPVPAASVVLKGGTGGTLTDNQGNFKLTVNHAFPFTIVISSIGYEAKEVEVQSSSASLDISL